MDEPTAISSVDDVFSSRYSDVFAVDTILGETYWRRKDSLRD